MNEDDIARHLTAHPDFFIRHPELLTHLNLPDPHAGKAISLAERQLAALRDKVKMIEARLTDLLRNGEESEIIAARIHSLAVALAAAPDRPGVIQALTTELTRNFGVPSVALRLWGAFADAADADSTDAYAPLDVETMAYADQLAKPQCSDQMRPAVLAWFGKAAGDLRSMALVALNDGTQNCGLLALGSQDASRFHADMGTHFLEQIADLASAALSRGR